MSFRHKSLSFGRNIAKKLVAHFKINKFDETYFRVCLEVRHVRLASVVSLTYL